MMLIYAWGCLITVPPCDRDYLLKKKCFPEVCFTTAGNIKNDECRNYLIELNEINILTAGQHDWLVIIQSWLNIEFIDCVLSEFCCVGG